MENEDRKIDISAKFMQMGQALMDEGTKTNDFTISQAGNILVTLSATILSEEEMFLFSQIAIMFTAKKIIDANRGYDDTEAIRKLMYIVKKKVKETKRSTKNKSNGTKE